MVIDLFGRNVPKVMCIIQLFLLDDFYFCNSKVSKAITRKIFNPSICIRKISISKFVLINIQRTQKQMLPHTWAILKRHTCPLDGDEILYGNSSNFIPYASSSSFHIFISVTTITDSFCKHVCSQLEQSHHKNSFKFHLIFTKTKRTSKNVFDVHLRR